MKTACAAALATDAAAALSPPTAPAQSQAIMCITNTSAILLWSALAAAAAYKCTSFETPFADSLTDTQRSKREVSCRPRRRTFYGAMMVGVGVFGVLGARYLRWRP